MSHKPKPWEHVEEESGEELWIMSYADMVTLLFGFFVILYSFSTLDEKKFQQMSEKMAAAFKSTEDFQKKTTADVGLTNEARQIRALQLLVAMLNLGENQEQALKKIEAAAANSAEMEALKSAMREKIKSDPNMNMMKSKSGAPPTIDLVLPEKILFASGMAELSPSAQKSIQKLGKNIRGFGSIEKIEVVGHTDSSPPSKTALFRSNFALSSARAGAVAQELMKSGIPAEMLSVKGMGDIEPLSVENLQNKPPSSTATPTGNGIINRRVHIILHKGAHRD
jgi:chemotaxis protein MotB